MIIWLSFLSPQNQPTVPINYSFIGSYVLCFLIVACVLVYVLGRLCRFLWRAVSSCSEFCHLIYSMPVLSRAVELPRFVLYLLYCVLRLFSLQQPFFVWNFKAQSTPVPRLGQKFYGFCRWRETSLVPVALVSFISMVMYIIYDLTHSSVSKSFRISRELIHCR